MIYFYVEHCFLKGKIDSKMCPNVGESVEWVTLSKRCILYLSMACDF